ncbi:hypothetical protein ACJX0J_020642, partial [Zea mays]
CLRSLVVLVLESASCLIIMESYFDHHLHALAICFPYTIPLLEQTHRNHVCGYFFIHKNFRLLYHIYYYNLQDAYHRCIHIICLVGKTGEWGAQPDFALFVAFGKHGHLSILYKNKFILYGAYFIINRLLLNWWYWWHVLVCNCLQH